MRRKRGPEVDSFTNLYQNVVGPGSIVSAVITGHLAIEFLLRKLVTQYDSKLDAIAIDLNHARLVSLAREIGAISEAQAAVLALINHLRNKLAHQLSYAPSIQELKEIFSAAATAFDDLTDGIRQGSEALESASSVHALEEWILPELFVQIAYDLNPAYIDRGADQELF